MAVFRGLQRSHGRLEAEGIVQDAEARPRAIGAHLAGRGEHDQRVARGRRLRLQAGDLRMQLVELHLGLRLSDEQACESGGVALDALEMVHVVA